MTCCQSQWSFFASLLRPAREVLLAWPSPLPKPQLGQKAPADDPIETFRRVWTLIMDLWNWIPEPFLDAAHWAYTHGRRAVIVANHQLKPAAPEFLWEAGLWWVMGQCREVKSLILLYNALYIIYIYIYIYIHMIWYIIHGSSWLLWSPNCSIISRIGECGVVTCCSASLLMFHHSLVDTCMKRPERASIKRWTSECDIVFKFITHSFWRS